MKKINTLFVILFAAMAVCGCGNSSQEAQVKKPDSIQQKEQKNKNSDLFEVKLSDRKKNYSSRKC